MDIKKYKKVYTVLDNIDKILNVILSLLFVSGLYFTLKFPFTFFIVASSCFLFVIVFSVASSIWLSKQKKIVLIPVNDFMDSMSGAKNILLRMFRFEIILTIVTFVVICHNILMLNIEVSTILFRAGSFVLVILAIGSSYKNYFRVRSIAKKYNCLAMKPYGEKLLVGDLDPEGKFNQQ